MRYTNIFSGHFFKIMLLLSSAKYLPRLNETGEEREGEVKVTSIKYTLYVHQKSQIATFNICFSNAQYPFRILCLPKQILKVIVYRKPDI